MIILCPLSFVPFVQVSGRDGDLEGEDCILVKSAWGGYKVKENVRFHLYINTAPCGDARIFSPHEESRGRHIYGRLDDHPNRWVMEDGEHP